MMVEGGRAVAKSSLDVFLRLHGQRKFAKELTAAGYELEAMGLKGAAAMSRFAASGEKLKTFGRNWTRHVSLPVVVGAGLAVKAAIDWESAFTGVRKTVNATEAQYASMERGIRQMSLHIPVAANDLAGIAEAAGQLGVERKAILSFTRTIADLGVSTNLAGEEGATTLARFANITQMPQSQFRRLGSTIVALGNAGASTESDIAAMGLRIAAAGNFVGMSEPQILGIANALSSVGIEAEAGGTSASQAIKVINSAVAGGGAKLARFAKVAGEGSQEFAAAWTKNPATALTSWIEGLARLKNEGEDVPALLNSLDSKLRGTRVQDTLLRAAGAGDLFRESLSLGSKAWDENNALSREAGKRYKTVASQLQILKNKVVDTGVTLGQELLPSLVKFVNVAGPAIGDIAHSFAALPGSVQASVLGFLVLTGPVASGLGYLASGVGRVLVMTRGLALAGKSLGVFTAAMQAGQGLGGSASMAFQGTGAAAALQTAKGFAYSLGPAVAAYGIGNIVTSALSHDWRDAGFEAGGAIAGGIAGFMLGGPMGAMLGVGIGSLGGELFSGLFNSGPSKLEAMAEHAANATDSYRTALKHLSGTQGRASRAEKAHRLAVQEANRASKEQAHILARFGGQSLPAYRAALRLAHANHLVAKTANQARKANELHGFALKLFRRESLHTVASEKQQIPVLRRHLAAVKRKMKVEGETTPLLKRTVNLQERLRGITDKVTKVYAEAEEKGGRPWAKRLKELTPLQAAYGREGKVLKDRLAEQRSEMTQLTEAGLKQTPMWEEIRRAIHGTVVQLENFQEQASKLHSPPGTSIPGHHGQGTHVPHHAGRRHPRVPDHRVNRRGLLPSPRVRQVKEGALSNIIEVHVVNQNTLTLDGKPVAEKTTKESRKAANLQ